MNERTQESYCCTPAFVEAAKEEKYRLIWIFEDGFVWLLRSKSSSEARLLIPAREVTHAHWTRIASFTLPVLLSMARVDNERHLSYELLIQLVIATEHGATYFMQAQQWFESEEGQALHATHLGGGFAGAAALREIQEKGAELFALARAALSS